MPCTSKIIQAAGWLGCGSSTRPRVNGQPKRPASTRAHPAASEQPHSAEGRHRKASSKASSGSQVAAAMPWQRAPARLQPSHSPEQLLSASTAVSASGVLVPTSPAADTGCPIAHSPGRCDAEESVAGPSAGTATLAAAALATRTALLVELPCLCVGGTSCLTVEVW